MADKIISRADAKAQGLKRFFTGLPCRHGHMAERLVSNRTCIECKLWKDRVSRAVAPEKKAASNRDYFERHYELILEWRRQYARENRERRAATQRNRAARKRAAEGHHTKDDIKRIYDAQKGRCAYCKGKVGNNYHVDHITPLSKGGDNWPKNLQVLCGPCNLSKSSRDPLDHAQSLGLLL